MSRIALSFILAIALAFLAGCNKEDSPTNPDTRSTKLMPLKSGNWWAMHMTMSRDDSVVREESDTTRIDTNFTRDGVEWFGEHSANYFYGEKPDGLWTLYLYPSGDTGRVELTFKYPANAGDTWITQPDSIVYSVVSTSETVVVPSGTFTGCMKYRYIASSGETGFYYFKPNVGNILHESSMEFSGEESQLRVEMTGYHLE